MGCQSTVNEEKTLEKETELSRHHAHVEAMWKQYDSLVPVPSAPLATHLSNNDTPSMSLFTSWTNISPVAAAKVQL